MPRRPIYAFEAIDDDLALIPLAARRLLDSAGQKLSLDGWLSLSTEDRSALVRAGAEGPAGAELSDCLSRAVPPPSPVERVDEPSETHVPSRLAGALDPSRPLDGAQWGALSGLDRYALVKCSSRPDKLARAYDEIVRGGPFTHLSDLGAARMVGVSSKPVTPRRATASARLRTSSNVVRSIAGGAIPKGDVLAAARVAGILASKRTAELIPLCHPVHTTSASIDLELDAARGEMRIVATVEAVDRTGVEMEAMVAATIAALTVYDMVKSADRWAVIDGVGLEQKSGGKSGDVKRPPERESEPRSPSRAASPQAAEIVAGVREVTADLERPPERKGP